MVFQPLNVDHQAKFAEGLKEPERATLQLDQANQARVARLIEIVSAVLLSGHNEKNTLCGCQVFIVVFSLTKLQASQ